MTTFPRTILPNGQSPPTLPGPLFSISDSGKMQTRSTQRVGWTWEETFLFEWNSAGRLWTAQTEYWFRNGTQLNVAHQGLSLLGSGGGTPLVDGATQTGVSINTKGWPLSTNSVLLAGDIITFANINAVYMVRNGINSDGSGDAAITFNPPIFAGGSPADEAAITITDSALFTAKIATFDMPVHGPNYWVAPRITWVEDP